MYVSYVPSISFHLPVRWLVEGAPFVLLLDVAGSMHRMNEWKADLWNIAGIPSPPDDSETNDAIVFGYLVAWFLGELLQQQKQLLVRRDGGREGLV